VNDVMIQHEGFASRCQKVLQVARQLHHERPDWVTFFRETLGVKGAARSVFPSQAEYVQFEQSGEFSEIQKMVATLRTRKAGGGKNEPTRVITVRLPESLHEALKAEASDHSTSMNKLCISKLLQVLAENEKATQAVSVPVRPAVPPTNPVPQPTRPVMAQPPVPQPAQSPQAVQSPGFRSTYNPVPSPQSQAPRYGQ
jgi:predicted HicB family RNase H-like nuclease